MRGLRAILTAAAVAALIPAGAQAQQAQPQLPDSLLPLVQELQQLQQELTGIQQRAMAADTSLQQEQVAVQQVVERTVLELDPTIAQRLARLEELEGEFRAAQEAQDSGRMQALMEEAQQIQAQVQEAQARALERPDVEQRIAAFREKLVARMATVEPRTPELMSRMEHLLARLDAATS
jgi:predicted  nucleic acid-binding Zn-ribbon protein